MEEIDSATTSTEPAPSDEADSTHDSVSANGKTYRFNPQWLKTLNWLQSKKSIAVFEIVPYTLVPYSLYSVHDIVHYIGNREREFGHYAEHF